MPVFLNGTALRFDFGEAPDIRLSRLRFDLAGVPPEAQFLVGKVYRGQFKQSWGGAEGNIWYFFLEQWNNGNPIFVVSQKGQTKETTLADRSFCSSFKVTDDRFAPDAPKCHMGPDSWTFLRDPQKHALVFRADDGSGSKLEANEVGVLPVAMLRK